jgi:hypothetical protein
MSPLEVMRVTRPREGYVVIVDHEGRMLNVATEMLKSEPEHALHALRGAAPWVWRETAYGVSSEPTTRFECRVDSVSEFTRDRTLAVVSVPNEQIEAASDKGELEAALVDAIGEEIVLALVDHRKAAN